MIQRHPNGIFTADLFEHEDWLEHGFGTRESVEWPEPERLAILKQIHSAIVAEAVAPGSLGEGDGLISNEPGLMVGVKTADCVPVLLADTRNRAVAAVHAGWKGTAGEIVLAAIGRMRAHYGTNPADIIAAIGPCIRSCCYEVGPEVAERFERWMPELAPRSKQKLDLVEVNRRQLMSVGIPEWRIESGAPCTYCEPDQRLHSFRRDGVQAGRMISAIGIRS